MVYPQAQNRQACSTVVGKAMFRCSMDKPHDFDDEIAPQSGNMPSLDHRLNSWSRYKSVLFTLFILSLEACHILIYCSSLNLPPLNPGVTNFQGHSFKILLTHPPPSIIYFPLHVIRLSCLGSERPHGLHVLSHAPKNIAPLLTTP